MKKTQPEIKKKTEVFDMDSIPQIELIKVDVTKYIGTKALIVKAEVIATQYGRAIRFETEVIAKEGTKENPIDIRASKLLGLQQNEEGVWGIGKGTKVQEFFDAWKLKTHKDMVGKTVVVQATEQKNGTQFLTFA